jgi:hypothetical protein
VHLVVAQVEVQGLAHERRLKLAVVQDAVAVRVGSLENSVAHLRCNGQWKASKHVSEMGAWDAVSLSGRRGVDGALFVVIALRRVWQ